MTSKHTLIVAGFVALIVGGIALPDFTEAYVPPEEMLSNLGAYIGPRDARLRAQEQQNVSQMRRTEEQNTLFTLQNPPREDERALVRTDTDEQLAVAQDGSTAAIIEALTQFLIGVEGQNLRTSEQRRTQRIIERLTLHAGASLDQQICYGDICQACSGRACGRPLARTGIGTVAAMLGLLIAGAWTVRRSSKAMGIRSTTL